jgi:hypothetical protein
MTIKDASNRSSPIRVFYMSEKGQFLWNVWNKFKFSGKNAPEEKKIETVLEEVGHFADSVNMVPVCLKMKIKPLLQGVFITRH